MQLGMIGLGRMGANLVRRLMADGHQCVVFDVDAAAVELLEKEGATGARSLDDFVAKLTPPRAAWIMVPAAFAGQTVNDLADRMAPGDIVIDGGNTYYRDDIDRAKRLLASRPPLRRRGNERRSVRARAGLLPHDRWRDRGGEQSRTALSDHRPRRRTARRARLITAGRPRAKRHQPSTATCTAVRREPATS